jgi:CBS domain containing-hemolysin-like protein
LDSVWDSIHTFVRIPAGAMLAAGAVGDVTPALEIAAGILGGGIAATSHATKTGTRLLINTSPEPFTNWSASFSGDVLVLSGLWAALKQPELFLVLFAVFMAVAIWVLPKLWYLIKTLLAKIGGVFGMNVAQPAESVAGHDSISALERLQHLRDKGALTAQEFEQQKNKILNGRP